jgi:hypothetical protein
MQRSSQQAVDIVKLRSFEIAQPHACQDDEDDRCCSAADDPRDGSAAEAAFVEDYIGGRESVTY